MPLQRGAAGWRVACRQRSSLRSKGGLLVCDPLLTWGATGSMGVKELLDAVDLAERGATGNNKALWERLSCRAQVLLPDFTALELSRLLFAFQKARHRDGELVEAVCENLTDEEGRIVGGALSANDAALVLKALSWHGRRDIPTVDFLLAAFAQDLASATTSDVSQLLSALVRLQLGQCLGDKRGLLNQLFATARRQMEDAYLPAADLTNLCVATASLPRGEECAEFLLAVARRFDRRAEAATSPRDLVQRLLSIAAFDDALLDMMRNEDGGPEGRRIVPVFERLGPQVVALVGQVACHRLAQRGSELDPKMSVAALDALSWWLARSSSMSPGGASVDVATLRPMLALVLQRMRGLSPELLQRTARAADALLEVPSLREEPLLQELLAALVLQQQQQERELLGRQIVAGDCHVPPPGAPRLQQEAAR